MWVQVRINGLAVDALMVLENPEFAELFFSVRDPAIDRGTNSGCFHLAPNSFFTPLELFSMALANDVFLSRSFNNPRHAV